MLKNKSPANHPNQTIILTGGGSAGHVTPNLALIEKLRQNNLANWKIYYIGSKNGQEKTLIQKTKIPYFDIATGKLRRYFSLQNFIDPIKILVGIFQAYFLCKKIHPQIIFSKGGFVAFPVVFAAWLQGIPVIIHESDFSPGLANKLSFPFATKICYTFKDTRKFINSRYKEKLVWSGTPIREELFKGNATVGRKICGFNKNKKIIFVQGGGLGASDVNQLIRKLLLKLSKDFQIVHSCGKGKIDAKYNNLPYYYQAEYFHEELPHILACADFVISRAGANSIQELIALKKPNILIPLTGKSSRGDQILNAKYCAKLNLSQVIYPKDVTAKNLYSAIYTLDKELSKYQKILQNFDIPNGTEIIDALISKSSMFF